MNDWQKVTLGDLCELLDHKRKPVTKRDRVSGIRRVKRRRGQTTGKKNRETRHQGDGSFCRDFVIHNFKKIFILPGPKSRELRLAVGGR